MKIKYVNFEIKDENVHTSWNQMNFFDCRVLSIRTDSYNAGKRMSIEIEAPKLLKKYFLYAWSDNGVCDAIEKSSLKVGDFISCHTELTYYQKDGRHLAAYKIVPDYAYDSRVPENERYFKLMVIKRESEKPKPAKKEGCLSKNDILMKMLG